MITDRPCARCGEIIHNAWHNQKYCKTCKPIVDSEFLKAHRIKDLADRPIRRCKVCGAEMPNYGNRQLCSEACRKISHDRARSNFAKDYYSKQIVPAVVEPKPKRKQKQKPLKGHFVGDAFYPDVVVKQPKIAYTFNQLQEMAQAQGISYKQCAERLGV